jgi:hypothetical protein
LKELGSLSLQDRGAVIQSIDGDGRRTGMVNYCDKEAPLPCGFPKMESSTMINPPALAQNLGPFCSEVSMAVLPRNQLSHDARCR